MAMKSSSIISFSMLDDFGYILLYFAQQKADASIPLIPMLYVWLFHSSVIVVNLAVVAEFLKSNYLGGKIPIFTSPHWEVAPWQIAFTAYSCKILSFN